MVAISFLTEKQSLSSRVAHCCRRHMVAHIVAPGICSQRKRHILAPDIMGTMPSKALLSRSDAKFSLRPSFYASGSIAARANRLK